MKLMYLHGRTSDRDRFIMLHPTDGGQSISLALYSDKKEEWHDPAGSYNVLCHRWRSGIYYYPFHQLAYQLLKD